MLAPDGTETILHSFTGGADSQTPVSGLTMDAKGNIFGTTRGVSIDSNQCPPACGAVFELTPDGVFTVLHTFLGGTDGDRPEGEILPDNLGNLYGTATSDGPKRQVNNPYGGEVFRLSLVNGKWVKKCLHAFTLNSGGYSPSGTLLLDSQGSIYGTVGGSSVSGEAYKLKNKAGVYTLITLFNFQESGGGSISGLSLENDGVTLYGTESQGMAGKNCSTPRWGAVTH